MHVISAHTHFSCQYRWILVYFGVFWVKTEIINLTTKYFSYITKILLNLYIGEHWHSLAVKMNSHARALLQTTRANFHQYIRTINITHILVYLHWIFHKGMRKTYSNPDPHRPPFSRLLRHTRGCGGLILTRILTGQ
jgi:hypothetical protein